MIEYYIFELGCLNSEKSVKMRKKQKAYIHVNEGYVKPGYGGKPVPERASWRHQKSSSLFAAVPQPSRTIS